MPNEQVRWIERLLTDEHVWCVVDQFPPNRTIELVTGREFLYEIRFSKPDERGGMQLFFGRRDVAPSPIWRTTEAGIRKLSLIASQAIQYVPSMIIGEQILLEGQMAIVRPVQYEEVGIDPKPIQKWFRQVTKSFIDLTMPGGVVLRDPETGATRNYPDIRASSGAAEWWRAGHLLKQFPKGAYEFDIRCTDDRIGSNEAV